MNATGRILIVSGRSKATTKKYRSFAPAVNLVLWKVNIKHLVYRTVIFVYRALNSNCNEKQTRRSKSQSKLLTSVTKALAQAQINKIYQSRTHNISMLRWVWIRRADFPVMQRWGVSPGRKMTCIHLFIEATVAVMRKRVSRQFCVFHRRSGPLSNSHTFR